ncbi:AAA family ATPase [Cuspidothrix issatschenkoi LEGE 03284]|uniref:AAA family ATPase n=1 Tax=Cuspidothrix issatschenkoi TaxID=230752 RepID=UPI00187F0F22|nr:AAA family ATPase [Cuspidothrix issatschenkoi]MBE9230521.1 AAA family ATPase [Cuspidothrix issatschenkoi LEGE 03284]
MRIKQIAVSGLFGIFDHVIPLNMDDRITVIHGPNGFGKTAMLRILNAFFNNRYWELRRVPFSKFRVEFDDDKNIEIVKTNNDEEEINKNITFDFYKLNSHTEKFSLKQTKIRSNADIPISRLDDFIPGLERIAPRKWLYRLNELKLIQELKNKSQAFYLKDEDLEKRLITEKFKGM